MSHEEWAEPAAHPALWNATLSRCQRVLLHAQPILKMWLNWSAQDGEESAYDPLCLSMKLFEVVIDQSGFGNEVVRLTVADALCPLLVALDRAGNVVPNADRYQRVSESSPLMSHHLVTVLC